MKHIKNQKKSGKQLKQFFEKKPAAAPAHRLKKALKKQTHIILYFYFFSGCSIDFMDARDPPMPTGPLPDPQNPPNAQKSIFPLGVGWVVALLTPY